MTRAEHEPISVEALHNAIPEGRWLSEDEVVELLIPVVDSPEPFRTTDARSAIDGLLTFGLLLQEGRRFMRPAPEGQTVPGRMSIVHRRRDETRRNDT